MGLIVLFLASARIRGRRRMDERALAVLKAMRDPDRLKELLAETDRWLLEEEIAALSPPQGRGRHRLRLQGEATSEVAT
jgi:hypothetical protein